MSDGRLLIVEDNLLVGTVLKDSLTAQGYDVTLAENGKSACDLLAKNSYELLLLDMVLPDVSGLELLPRFAEDYPNMMVIVLTAHGDIPMAVECLRAGAYDFLTKPVESLLLRKTIDKALEHHQLHRKVHVLSKLSQRGSSESDTGPIIAEAPATKRLLELVHLLGENELSCVLLTGESGTGKGLFARAIHDAGPRAERPFVDVNCSALPATMVESELFGHKKGSFTDAKADKIGVFDMADGGTLFLDEIGDMDVSLQTKLLKVIEDQRFRRIGGTEEIKVNVSIIAATNQDLEDRVAQGLFRADLYYRLNVMPLQIPPLRERREEILPMCERFISHFARRCGKPITGLTNTAKESLETYSWPGNVRELRNVIERGCLLATGSEVDCQHLLINGDTTAGSSSSTATSELGAMTLEDAERMVIEAAMREANGNRNQAARILGIHRTTLYKKLEALKIDHDCADES